MAPAGAAAAAASEVDVEGGLGQLAAALQQLAPTLAPSAAPGPSIGAASRAIVGQLYQASEKELQELEAGCPQECGICKGARSGAAAWALDWDINTAKRRMAPKRCMLLCSQCSSLRNLPGLIERITMQQVSTDGKDDAAISESLRHFLSMNGHDAADAHFLQDAISVAHAMMVVYKELRLQLVQGPPLPELFGAAPSAKKGAAPSAKKGAAPSAKKGAAPSASKKGAALQPKSAAASSAPTEAAARGAPKGVVKKGKKKKGAGA